MSDMTTPDPAFIANLAALALPHVQAGKSMEEATVLALQEYQASLFRLRAAMADPAWRAYLLKLASDTIWHHHNPKA